MELVVAGTTARTAGALVGLNHKTAAYYFHRLREIIFIGRPKTKHLLPARWKWTRVTSVASGRDGAAEGLLERSPYSGA